MYSSEFLWSNIFIIFVNNCAENMKLSSQHSHVQGLTIQNNNDHKNVQSQKSEIYSITDGYYYNPLEPL